MLKLIVLSFLVAYVYAAWYEEQAEYWIKKTNSKHMPWKAGYNAYLAGKSEAQIKRLMGTKMDRRGLAQAPKMYYNVDKAAVPATFDSAKNWPKCASTINYIKDQADCGSCWAVAASSVVADRICIGNYGMMSPADGLNEAQPPIDMSGEQIMSCCMYCGQGCGGGYPIDAMKYWNSPGIVTGGWYGSNCGCQPYQIPPCGPQGCNQPEANTPPCMSSCPTKKVNFASDHHMAKTYYQIGGTAAQIQQEIMSNGPVECAFDVYANFMSYQGGVYNQTSGQLLGGHAVKIVGWGVYASAGNMPYWIIHNSWNTTWGMNGVFWFLRGSDLAGMEDQCVAGMAKAEASKSNFMLKC